MLLLPLPSFWLMLDNTYSHIPSQHCLLQLLLRSNLQKVRCVLDYVVSVVHDLLTCVAVVLLVEEFNKFLRYVYTARMDHKSCVEKKQDFLAETITCKSPPLSVSVLITSHNLFDYGCRQLVDGTSNKIYFYQSHIFDYGCRRLVDGTRN